jgi:uncharacterized protein (TIGR02679 family)
MVSSAAARIDRPDLAPLVDELARRFSEGGTPVAVTLRDVPEATLRAVADLLGADRVPRSNPKVRVERLAAALRLGSPEEVRSLIEELRGPIPDRRAARLSERAAREALWSWLSLEASALRLGNDSTGLALWVDNQRVAGARGGAGVHRRRLETALRVLQALPAEGISLAALANDCAGDPHALDQGRALSAMVLEAISAAFCQLSPTDAEASRSMWEMAGVVPDPHSSTVLALGLPGGPGSPLAQWLVEAAGERQPVVLSLANLRKWPVAPLPAGSEVFVVENPSLIAEALRAGICSPLVCSSGRPTVATVTLLRQLGAKGASLYQHADFDPAGLSITAWLAARAATVPWHMDSSDYLDAVPVTTAEPTITGPVPSTPWDTRLRSAVDRLRVPVYEEQIREGLFRAMDASSTRRAPLGEVNRRGAEPG